MTPASYFARMVPWLVLFATTVFAYGSFGRRRTGGVTLNLGAAQAAAAQFAIAIYGGYFGGGIGFLMLAALTMAGLPTRNAGATKNVLAGVMNAAAVALFAFSPAVQWRSALILGVGAILGGLGGRLGAEARRRHAASHRRGLHRHRPHDRAVRLPRSDLRTPIAGRNVREGHCLSFVLKNIVP